MALYLLVMAPILVAAILYLVPGRASRWLALGAQGALTAAAFLLFARIHTSGQPVINVTGGPGALGIMLYCDRTAAVFLLLIVVIFCALLLYGLHHEARDRLFLFLLVVLESLIMLIFLSRDLFNIFLAVEVSTMVCAILIMYKRDSRSLYDGLVYLLTNMVGMLFFLMGVGLLYRQFGALNITTLRTMMAGVTDGRMVLLPYAFIMTGVGLKCAFMPVFSWLPKAHGTPGAPAVVSALLSGLYVKGSLYLYMRLTDMFSPALEMSWFFLAVGILTGLGGVALALTQRDIKLILAYSTISQLGIILIGLSVGREYAQSGALLHLINHAFFKSLLFLAAGMVIDRYKTRNLDQIGGVMKAMPWTGAAILAGMLGITGAPFFNGSVSKYFIQAGSQGLPAEVFIILINAGTVLIFVKFSQLLAGQAPGVLRPADWAQTATVTLLAILCLLTGVLELPLTRLLGLQLTISPWEYGQKALIWAASIAGGAIAYRYVISRLALFRRGWNLELSFNGICACIVGFFMLILGAGWLGIR